MLCGCAGSTVSETEELTHPRPNILFIMSDDHTSQAWGIYGGVLQEYVINKNIKRLANEGMILDNVFCTNSICVPSRGTILTGQYSHQNGIYTLSDALDPSAQNIAKSMKAAGYETAVIGKWHLKKEPAGFDHYMVLPGQGRYHNPLLKTEDNWEDANRGGKMYQGFSADVIGDQTVEWLSNRENDKPFFLKMHFKATHEPFDYPKRYNDLYKDVSIPEPETLYDFSPSGNNRTFVGQKLAILQDRYETASQADRIEASAYPGLPFSTEGMSQREARHHTYQKFVKDFMRSGAAIDDNIGKVLDYLELAGLEENTVVIYTADQGYFLGEHGMMDKRMMYEESLRMPFVIRYPEEIKAGTRNQDMILNIDFPALFADYAAIEKPPYIHGKSFRPKLIGNTVEDWREDMYYRYWLHQEQRPAHFGIRTNTYKLIFYYGLPLDMPGSHEKPTTPAWEFYDLENDPAENRNAYNDPKYRDIIFELKKSLNKHRQNWGDTDKDRPEMLTLLNKYYPEAS